MDDVKELIIDFLYKNKRGDYLQLIKDGYEYAFVIEGSNKFDVCFRHIKRKAIDANKVIVVSNLELMAFIYSDNIKYRE
jgi:hypothetical protein